MLTRYLFSLKRYVQLLGGGSGSGCFGRGYSCGDKELSIATSRLKGYFSLVLITDTSLHFRVGGMLMKHKFGWLASSDTDKARRGTHVEVNTQSPCSLCVPFQALHVCVRCIFVDNTID